MNDFLLAALLGIVEGITEFLPVSSTAHLRLAQHFLGVTLEDEFWKLFAVFIQLGAILAVMVLYRARLKQFATEAPRLVKDGPYLAISHPIPLIGLAFLCTAIPAFLLKKVIGKNLENIPLMAGSLLVGGIVMIAVDLLFRHGKTTSVEKMRPWQAAAIGLIQVLSAVFPGTSRSMSTIAGGQLVGLSRSAALEFSFLVSIPVMIVACGYDLLKYVKETKAAGAEVAISAHQAGVMAVGFVVSFVVAYAVIAWFLGYVRKHGFVPFGVYRIVAGAALLYFLA